MYVVLVGAFRTCCNGKGKIKPCFLNLVHNLDQRSIKWIINKKYSLQLRDLTQDAFILLLPSWFKLLTRRVICQGKRGKLMFLFCLEEKVSPVKYDLS